jgi:O-antigen/teichoic acid export membrane protein
MAADRIKEKAFAGIGALVLRNFLRQPISFISFFALSVFLEQWELGVFWAVSEIIGFLGYFSDVGLAAALIQKKEQPEKKEIRTTFTIQQIIVLLLISTTVLLTPFLQNKFDFSRQGKYLLYALLFGFFTSSLKTIPSVYLERKLKFRKLAIVDLSEQIVFSGLAVFLAWRGLGVDSWIWAVVVRSLTGLVLINIFSPWPIGLSLELDSIKELFNFGIPYQANSLLAVVKDRLVNIFLWGIIGSTGMGILGWAQKWSQLPLRLLMDSVIRVCFPAYSRIQKNKQRMKMALQRAGFFVNLIIFPLLGGLAISIPKMIRVFPQYEKWSNAIIPLWLYLANFGFGAATTPLINAFNAVGKVKLNLKLMGMWTILTWLTVPIMAKTFGVNGAAGGLLIVSASSVVAWWLVKREFKINLLKTIGLPFMITFIMVGFLIFINRLIPDSMIGLGLLVISGGLIYAGLTFCLVRDELDWFFSSFKKLILKR